MEAYGPRDGLNQFFGVVGYSVFEDEFNLLYVFDFAAGIAFEHHDVSAVARFKRTYAIGFAQKVGAVLRGDVNGFEWGEASSTSSSTWR